MNLDLFFNAPRWKILEVLAKNPSSPIQISKNLNTSVSYISQQLKLLETANLVVKARTKNVDKGLPRNVFSIVDEIAYLSLLLEGVPVKKVLKLDEFHKIILRIWLVENPDLHYFIEKAYWRIESELKDIKGIYFDGLVKEKRLIIFSDSKKVKKECEELSKEADGDLEFKTYSISDYDKTDKENLISIYDDSNFSNEIVKGGRSK